MFNCLWSVSLTYLLPQNLHLRVTLKNLNVENANIKVKYQHKFSLTVQKNADLIQNTEIIEQYAQLLGLLNILLPVFFPNFTETLKTKTTQVSLEALMARIKRKEAEIKNGGAQPRN